MRRVLQTVIGLCLLAAALGLWLGMERASITETVVIERMASEYEAQTGGKREDCFAVPGDDRVWLTVICEGAAGRFGYPVNRWGRLLPTEPTGGT